MSRTANSLSDRSPRWQRRGVALVEGAFALPVVLLMLFALLDLGLATVRYNSLAEAARQIAREAIIHGSLSPQQSQAWGPDEYLGTAASADGIVQKAAGLLPTMRPEEVQVHVTWPDNGNSPRDQVRVEVTYRHDPLVPGLFAWGAIDLRSSALMRIVN
jgi:Flp pilus assembly protein TadG